MRQGLWIWMVGLVLFLHPIVAWAIPDTVLSVSPDATDGTTITASDENTRSTSIETAHNNHGHVDITQTGTPLNIGATSGRSSIGDTSVILEGATNDAFETTITVTDPTADNTITLPNDDGVVMPDGALIFMLGGSCPPGTTDITATHSDRFVRINATGGSTGGANTHDHGSTTGSHTLITSEIPAHVHTDTLRSNLTNDGTTSFVTGDDSTSSGIPAGTSTGGDGGHTHTLTTGVNNIPTFVTAKLCEVN